MKMTTSFHLCVRLRFNESSLLQSHTTELPNRRSLLPEKRTEFILIYARLTIHRHVHPVRNLTQSYLIYLQATHVKALLS